jgi:hypothetical protein
MLEKRKTGNLEFSKDKVLPSTLGAKHRFILPLLPAFH